MDDYNDYVNELGDYNNIREIVVNNEKLLDEINIKKLKNGYISYEYSQHAKKFRGIHGLFRVCIFF